MPSRRMGLSISLAVLVLGIAYVVFISQGNGRDDGPPPIGATGPALIELGARLYADNCAACHGVNLGGEPGFDWRQRKPDGTFPAPPHDETGHTWHHTDDFLFAYTATGGQAFLGDTRKSGMPGFVDILTLEEAEAIFAFIKNSWPESIRERQRQITDAARRR